MEYSDILIHMSDIVAEFDCLFCYAQVAKQFNFVKPILTTESYFLIKDGRHVLSEITAERQFIPNDFFVYNYIDEYDQDFTTSTSHPINKNHSNKFILLSGPNFSGKSIYLKQVNSFFLRYNNDLLGWNYCLSLSHWFFCSSFLMQNRAC